MVTLAVTSILYGAILALRQESYKKLVAYSSLSHMGYIVLGIFSFEDTAVHGAMLQMLSHGVTVAGLFLLLGMLEQRDGPHYRQLTALSTIAPRFAVLLMLFVLTSLALPLTSGFTAEFLILFGAFMRGFAVWRAAGGPLLLVAALLAATGMVLGATYMLRFARALLFGKSSDPLPTNEDRPVHESGPAHEARPARDTEGMRDAGLRETASLAALLLLILWVGIAPAAIMSRVQNVVSQLAGINPVAVPVPQARARAEALPPRRVRTAAAPPSHTRASASSWRTLGD
jgi:NADH-quinone oxidoreductase subunit M